MLEAQPLERNEVKVIRWEIDRPVYRVDFWRRFEAPPGGQPERMGYKQDAYQLTGASSVNEVISWAHEYAQGRSFVIYAAVPGGAEGPGLIRLEGIDPTIPLRSADTD